MDTAARQLILTVLVAHPRATGTEGWGAHRARCACGPLPDGVTHPAHVADLIAGELDRLERGYASTLAAAEPDASPPGGPDAPGADPHDASASAGVLSSAWRGDHCSSCRTPILWRRHSGTGKAAPINARPDPTGNVMLVEPDLYVVIGKAGPPEGTEDQPRHTNHFATCPQAGGHHRGA